MRALLITALALTVAGCGAAAPPPPAGPERTAPVRIGDRVARVDGRARTLDVYDQGRRVDRVAAGVGPTALAAGDGRLYVTDTVQGALLIFDFDPRLELQRRVYLPGGPGALAVDRARGRLWVALTDRDEVVELSADGAAKLRGRHPTVDRPRALSVDPATGAVTVRGAAGERQVLDRRSR